MSLAPYRLGSNLRSQSREGLSRSVCLGLGLSVSVCQSVSRSVSLCLGRAGHMDEHTHDVNSAVWVARAYAMSIVHAPAAGETGIAHILSKAIPNWNNLSKGPAKHSISQA